MKEKQEKKKAEGRPFWRRLQIRTWHRHPFFLPVLTFLTLTFLGAAIFVVYDGREVKAVDGHIVILSHDKQRQVLPTRAATVGDFLEKAKVTLNDGDVVEPDLSTEIVSDNLRVNVYRARPVLIVDGGQKTFAFSAATTTRSVAAQVGVTVYPEDWLESQPETNFLGDGAIGEKVTIKRATPVNLNLYGSQAVVRTHATTVGELLEDKKIMLASDDNITPSKDTKLSSLLLVYVTRKGVKIETVEETVPMQTQYVEDKNLSFGTTAIRQQGAAGKKLVTYQIDSNTGEKKRLQDVVIQEPVVQIVARGKAVYIPEDKGSLMAAAGISPSDYPYVNFIISHESGWCPTKLQGHPGVCPPYAPASIPSGLGYGLCQSTPGSKMASAGGDWQANAVTQLRWCSGYAKKYGGWEGSYNFWMSKHWW